MNIDKNIQEIPIEDIIPNRFQPRLAFNEEGINELSESIKQHGIIQPLVVRPLGDKYEIIAGERRYKAATQAGLTKVPVIVSNVDDNQSAEVALVENIQRRNLTAIEEAKSYKNLLDRGYLTQEQLANKMGVSQSSIANKLRLLNLDEEVQDALLNEKISERHARALLSLEDKEDQKKWLKRIIDERLTVRQLDIELKKAQNNEDVGEEEIPLVEINPNIEEIVNNAEDINVVREAHDVASMLIPEGGIIEEPKAEELAVETPSKMPNKFFNFLEDEEVNMNVLEPEEIFNTFNATPSPINPPEEPKEETTPVEQTRNTIENEVEILDDLDDLNETPEVEKQPVNQEINANPFVFNETMLTDPTNLNPTEPVVETNQEIGIQEEQTPVISPETTPEILPTLEPIVEQQEVVNEQPMIENQIEEITTFPIANEPVEEASPFKSIFFNREEESTEQQPISNEPVINNTIEEVTPVIEEDIVDPLDSIVKLEPDYEAKQEELAGTDLKTAINTIRETVNNLEQKGFVIEMEEADLENLYHITIKINKE